MTRTVFTGGQVFDGTGAPIADADVVVEDGLIAAVGPGLDGDEAVDVGGRVLLPGLFDCHTHVMITHLDLLRRLETPFSYNYYLAALNLRRTLDIGITTIRDAAGADLGVKQAVAEGLIAGPRMQISLTALSQTGGHGDGWMACGADLNTRRLNPAIPHNLVDGPDEMRRKVRELVRAGADVIKVCTSGGVLSPRDNPQHAHFRMDELEVLVTEASAAGLFVMTHAQAIDGIKNAVRAGIRSIEHGIYLDDEAVEMMVDRGTWLVPTLVAPRGVERAYEAGAAIPEASIRKAREVMAAHRESFARAVSAGVKVAMGTDSGVTPHGENLTELALMRDGGMKPEDVLVATTRSAAVLMDVADELGTIEPGKRADLVVVNGDPLDFESLPESIEAVYKDGARAG